MFPLLSSAWAVTTFALNCCQGSPDSSVGKESACNSGNPGSIPGSERSPGEGIGYPLQYSWASLVAQLGKNLLATQQTPLGSIPGLRRFPGEEKGYPLQYSGLENSMNYIVHGITKSWTWVTFILYFTGNFNLHVDNDPSKHMVLKGKYYFREISLLSKSILLQTIQTHWP